MSIISKVGRKQLSVKLQIAGIHAILTLGAISILIPFIVMITLSMASVTDLKEISLYPKYVFSGPLLFKKYLAAKNNEDLATTRNPYPFEGKDWISWSKFHPPLHDYSAAERLRMETLKADWDEFVQGLPRHFTNMYFTTVLSSGLSQNAFQSFLAGRYQDVADFNRKNHMNQPYLSQVSFPQEGGTAFYYPDTPFMKDYLDFKAAAPVEFKKVVNQNYAYSNFLYSKYKNNIAFLNQAWGTRYSDPWFTDVAFPLTAPLRGAQRRDWLEFVQNRFPLLAVTLKGGSRAGYLAFIKGRFKSIAEFNKVADTRYKSWNEVTFSQSAPPRAEISVWGDYARTLSPGDWVLDFPELRYRDFLLKKYGSLQKAWQSYGVDLTSPAGEGLLTPEKYVDELNFKNNRVRILWHFMTDNYVQVSRFMLLQGRAAINTTILVLLSVLTSLVINPFAAYALSRFRLSYTSKILLFLLATAAFPAEVTQIPQFLMMKDLGMLNTFWALVLPGVANGFFIFLLKGFFDSLPKEIFEAAILDGASEIDMFRRIAVPLASPILAVIALGAFTYAYSAYQFAIVVCPDPKMWTLMVYLQQFMNTNPYSLVMASFVLASIPTLAVFLMAQRVILRGIVIPSMH